MSNKMFITTVNCNGKEVFVFQVPGEKGFTFLQDNLKEEERETLSKIFPKDSKICLSKDSLKRRMKVLTFSLIATLVSKGQVYAQANVEGNVNTSIEKTIDNLETENLTEDEIRKIVEETTKENVVQLYDIDSIIQKYHLEESREIIKTNFLEFCKYYDTIVKNQKIMPEIYPILLKDFSYFQQLGVLDHIQKRLATLIVGIDDFECMIFGASGLYENNYVRFISNASDETKAHELYHSYAQLLEKGGLLYDIDEKKFYDENDPNVAWERAYRLSFGFFDESIAADISSSRYSKRQYSNTYEDMADLLQVFYLIFGKQDILKHYLNGELSPYLVTQLKESHLSDEEMIRLLANLEIVRQYASFGFWSLYSGELDALTEEEIKVEKWKINLNIDRTKTTIVDTMLKIYENKTGKKWMECKELQASLEAFIGGRELQYTYYTDTTRKEVSNFYGSSAQQEKPSLVTIDKEYYTFAKKNSFLQYVYHPLFNSDDQISQVKYTPEDERADFKILFNNGKEIWYDEGEIVRYYSATYEDPDYGNYETKDFQMVKYIK